MAQGMNVPGYDSTFSACLFIAVYLAARRDWTPSGRG